MSGTDQMTNSRPLEVENVASTVVAGGRILRGVLVAFGVVLIGTAVWLGVSARFIGLDALQLAVDEYYFVRGVQLILEHGVPLFATGGYYIHGVLAQYPTAVSVIIFGENGFGYRLPAVLFSLGSIFLLYVYSRKFLEPIPAGLVCAMLLVSAWHIEFARFIRMYSQLQFLALLFFIVFDKAFFGGWWQWRYLPHVIAILAFFTHTLGFLLMPLLFLPLVLRDVRRRFLTWTSMAAFAVTSMAIVILSHSIFTLNFRRQGASSPLPEGYVMAFSPSSRFRLPEFPFWGISEEPLLNLVFFLVVCGLVVTLLTTWRYVDRRLTVTDILLTLSLVAALFHMFVVAFGLILLLIFRYQLHRLDQHPWRSYGMLFAAFVIGALWISHALLSTEWVNLVGSVEPSLFKALGRTFFGWPDFYTPVFLPWFRELPILGLIVFAALAYQIATRMKDPPSRLVQNPAFVVCYIAFCLGVLQSPVATTRYAFFVYPLILLVVVLSIVDVFKRILGAYDKSSVQVFAALACLGLFIWTDDFHARQITNISSEGVRFRVGEFERHALTWYPRSDFESPAEFVNGLTEIDSTTKVIVVGLPVISYYLQAPHAMYYNRDGRRFYNVSRVGGTVDLWSNQRLLSTDEEVRDYTTYSDRVLIIRSASADRAARDGFDIAEIWRSRLRSAERLAAGRDNKIEVIMVTLNDPVTGRKAD